MSNEPVQPIVHADQPIVATMVLPTHSAVALWYSVVRNQLSNGTWATLKPRNHHRYWMHVEVTMKTFTYLDFQAIAFPAIACLRNRYDLLRLVKGDDAYAVNLKQRMVNVGRLAQAGASIYADMSDAADAMPSTLAEYGTLPSNIKSCFRKIDAFDDVVVRYYDNANYTLRDVKSDLRDIKKAMSLAVINH